MVKNGRNPADYSIAQLRLVYLAKSDDQAWADTQEHLFSMMEFYGEIVAEANDVPGDKDAFPFKSPRELRDSPSVAPYGLARPIKWPAKSKLSAKSSIAHI